MNADNMSDNKIVVHVDRDIEDLMPGYAILPAG
jgi:hypothetical protein